MTSEVMEIVVHFLMVWRAIIAQAIFDPSNSNSQYLVNKFKILTIGAMAKMNVPYALIFCDCMSLHIADNYDENNWKFANTTPETQRHWLQVSAFKAFLKQLYGN